MAYKLSIYRTGGLSDYNVKCERYMVSEGVLLVHKPNAVDKQLGETPDVLAVPMHTINAYYVMKEED